ncbi:hypothetical protein CDL15_Pgr005666 [Punica granatum]|uniref:CCT domain-containing protein n=1 Tax=Punica granatum TaxID=22663 RepID=A0A218WG78_PUNGR|nr:hypothetical protein CDL15_Pgr005666 [Punica granatum]
MSSPSSPSPTPGISMRASDGDRRHASRRSRTRTRKPKFLSLLRIELSATAAEMTDDRRHRRKQRARQHHQQLSLFPLHPEEAASGGLVDETKDVQSHYEENVNVNLLFNGEDTSATTLNGLLDGGEAAAVACSEEGSVGSRDSVPRLRDGADYGRGDHQHRSSLLVRAAMKSGGREEEEKWVSYNEVVERKAQPDQEPEEVSSCSAAANSSDRDRGQGCWQRQPRGEGERWSGGLLLKLDYEEILNSWSDKGSLFIGYNGGPLHYHHHEAPQRVPELNAEHPGLDSTVNNGLSDRWGSSANVWTVPDQKIDGGNSMPEEKEGRSRQREASVLRYKEKRQNRLFSKRIRYEVRKLNAEKRPRIKVYIFFTCQNFHKPMLDVLYDLCIYLRPNCCGFLQGRFVRRSSEDD